jgi:hypothetical protein
MHILKGLGPLLCSNTLRYHCEETSVKLSNRVIILM